MIDDSTCNESQELFHVQLSPENVRVVTLEQLDAAYQAGSIGDDTLIWQEGLESWLPLGSLLGGDDSGSEDEPEMSAATGEAALREVDLAYLQEADETTPDFTGPRDRSDTLVGIIPPRELVEQARAQMASKLVAAPNLPETDLATALFHDVMPSSPVAELEFAADRPIAVDPVHAFQQPTAAESLHASAALDALAAPLAEQAWGFEAELDAATAPLFEQPAAFPPPQAQTSVAPAPLVAHHPASLPPQAQTSVAPAPLVAHHPASLPPQAQTSIAPAPLVAHHPASLPPQAQTSVAPAPLVAHHPASLPPQAQTSVAPAPLVAHHPASLPPQAQTSIAPAPLVAHHPASLPPQAQTSVAPAPLVAHHPASLPPQAQTSVAPAPLVPAAQGIAFIQPNLAAANPFAPAAGRALMPQAQYAAVAGNPFAQALSGQAAPSVQAANPFARPSVGPSQHPSYAPPAPLVGHGIHNYGSVPPAPSVAPQLAYSGSVPPAPLVASASPQPVIIPRAPGAPSVAPLSMDLSSHLLEMPARSGKGSAVAKIVGGLAAAAALIFGISTLTAEDESAQSPVPAAEREIEFNGIELGPDNAGSGSNSLKQEYSPPAEADKRAEMMKKSSTASGRSSSSARASDALKDTFKPSSGKGSSYDPLNGSL